MKLKNKIIKMIIKNSIFLNEVLYKMIEKKIENSRLIKVVYSLIKSGFEIKDVVIKYIFNNLNSYKKNNIWTNTEENIYSYYIIKKFKRKYVDQIYNCFLLTQNKDGGWGRYVGDISRITSTSFVIYNLSNINPQFKNTINYNKAIRFVYDCWKNDFNGIDSLLYKAAYFLLAFSTLNNNRNICEYNDLNILIDKTLNLLISNKERNGGYKPYKKFPGNTSIIYSTIILNALSSSSYITKPGVEYVIYKIVNYLYKNMLSSGGWPIHEIENITSEIIITLIKVLKNEKN